MQDILLVAALLAALAVGWWLGSQGRNKRTEAAYLPPDSHIQELNRLFQEQPDESIQSLFQQLGNHVDTVEAHFALGRLFRSRGEVEKATQVHQMLLARTDLPPDKLQLTQFELANDYMVAGLLDRAERLLTDLSQEEGEFKWRGAELLMQLYQHEKEWDLAIAAAETLLPRQGNKVRTVLAHYCCEKAAEVVAKGDYNTARRELKRALGFDNNAVRASLLKGQIEAQAGNFKEAVKAYRRVKSQDAAYLTEAIPALADCYRQLDKEREFTRYLMDCLARYPSATLVVIAADIQRQIAYTDPQLQRLIKEQLTRYPSLRGLLRFIDMQIASVEGNTVAADRLLELKQLCARLVELKPIYRCTLCGYSGKRLVWLCPGCQHWGTIKPIYSAEGE